MKIELNIPEDLSEITLEQYQAFLKIEEPTSIDLLSVVLKKSTEAINKMPLHSVNEISEGINKLFEEQQEFKQLFKIGSQEFGFIPDLDAITFGENTDLLNYIKEWETMHKAMAVMFRPITLKQKGKYLIEEYKSASVHEEIMKKAPLSVVLGAQVFFYHLTNELLKSTLSYLEKEMDSQQKGKQPLQNSGQNITNSLSYLKETLGDLMKFPTLKCTSV
jgi:hypothetical protein